MRFLVILALFLLCSACLPFKALYLGQPDAKDLKRLPHQSLKASDNPFEFQIDPDQTAAAIKINDWTRDIPFFMTLDSFVRIHKVRSFLVIHRDSIKFEYYQKKFHSKTLHPSYSIAKSFTSVLTGIAMEEGHIQSEKDLVIKYLPELKSVAPEFEQLRIEHLLNHTSGIKFSLPIDASIYYGNHSRKIFRRIRFQHPPGTVQHYININVQLLAAVIEQASSKSLVDYLQEKIWSPIGMESDAIWLADKKDKLPKAFCCLGAVTRDYARFGRLMLHEGSWEGKQIISKAWHQQSIARDTSEGSSFNYNYCWHIGLKAYGDYMAIGLYKQHIYINPSKELIIVSLCDKEKKLLAERVNWWYIFRQIADQYD